jgi:hypothetical protein
MDRQQDANTKITLSQLGLDEHFLHCKIEGKRLLSGNVYGTRPGRNFSFDLETHSFFDFNQPLHSGKGIKRLFEIRGEILPEKYRLTYARFEKNTNVREKFDRLSQKNDDAIYVEGPLEVVPPQMTPPSHLTLWDKSTNKRIVVPAKVYTYKNLMGQTIGYILRVREGMTEIVRPLSVWARLVGEDNKTIHSYRQKAFVPHLYKAEHFLVFPEYPIVIVDNEELVDHIYRKKKALPMLITTWPFGPGGMLANHQIWQSIAERKVFLLPEQDDRSINQLSVLRKIFLPTAKIINTLPNDQSLFETLSSFEPIKYHLHELL